MCPTFDQNCDIILWKFFVVLPYFFYLLKSWKIQIFGENPDIVKLILKPYVDVNLDSRVYAGDSIAAYDEMMM